VDDGLLRVELLFESEIGRVAIRNGRSRAGLDAEVLRRGGVSVVLAAQALDPIEIAAALTVRPDGWRIVGEAPPALRLERGSVAVHAVADEWFLLQEVLIDERSGQPRRTLRSWRGRADGLGRASFDVVGLCGEGDEPVHLVLVVPRRGGGVAWSRVLEIGPSGPDPRGERAR
jgi:hypothetical protein